MNVSSSNLWHLYCHDGGCTSPVFSLLTIHEKPALEWRCIFLHLNICVRRCQPYPKLVLLLILCLQSVLQVKELCCATFASYFVEEKITIGFFGFNKGIYYFPYKTSKVNGIWKRKQEGFHHFPSPPIFPLGYTSKSLFCQGQQNLSQTTKGREKQKAQFAITHQFDMCVKKGHSKGEESTLDMKLSLDESK